MLTIVLIKILLFLERHPLDNIKRSILVGYYFRGYGANRYYPCLQREGSAGQLWVMLQDFLRFHADCSRREGNPREGFKPRIIFLKSHKLRSVIEKTSDLLGLHFESYIMSILQRNNINPTLRNVESELLSFDLRSISSSIFLCIYYFRPYSTVRLIKEEYQTFQNRFWTDRTQSDEVRHWQLERQH